jgi:hypothetical protein
MATEQGSSGATEPAVHAEENVAHTSPAVQGAALEPDVSLCLHGLTLTPVADYILFSRLTLMTMILHLAIMLPSLALP